MHFHHYQPEIVLLLKLYHFGYPLINDKETDYELRRKEDHWNVS